MKRFDTSFGGEESGVFVLDRPERDDGAFGTGRSSREDEARGWLAKLRALPPVRLAKVMKIREQIARGTYETEAKWRVAIERLLEDLRS